MDSEPGNVPALAVKPFGALVDATWDDLTDEFETVYQAMDDHPMARKELSFHTYVKLLGYLALDIATLEGDILEIGVWKGKSLALMRRLSPPSTRVIGVDPCGYEGQAEELRRFQSAIFPETQVIEGFSEHVAADVAALTTRLKLLHIDGGHDRRHVWADFLIYGQLVVPGGYVVFDDYADEAHSPEVRPAVDDLRRLGFFAEYDVIGPVRDYENSYVIRRR